MDFDYDVVIVGSAFLGAATAKLLRKRLFRWWKAELTSLRLMFVSPVAESLKEPSAASTVAA
jgi:hypothetical protein